MYADLGRALWSLLAGTTAVPRCEVREWTLPKIGRSGVSMTSLRPIPGQLWGILSRCSGQSAYVFPSSYEEFTVMTKWHWASQRPWLYSSSKKRDFCPPEVASYPISGGQEKSKIAETSQPCGRLILRSSVALLLIKFSSGALDKSWHRHRFERFSIRLSDADLGVDTIGTGNASRATCFDPVMQRDEATPPKETKKYRNR